MRAVDVGEFESPGALTRFDELTLVRRYVRSQLAGRIQACGASVRVAWANGEVEDLRFDETVGYPVEPVRDWVGEWKAEVQR